MQIMGKCRLRVVEGPPRVLIAASFLISDESLSRKEVLLRAGFSQEEIKEDTEDEESSKINHDEPGSVPSSSNSTPLTSKKLGEENDCKLNSDCTKYTHTNDTVSQNERYLYSTPSKHGQLNTQHDTSRLDALAHACLVQTTSSTRKRCRKRKAADEHRIFLPKEEINRRKLNLQDASA